MTAIKNGTLLVKDSNGNTARVATLSQTDITTLNTALADIDANKRKISSISVNYVTTNTAQTITGQKTLSTNSKKNVTRLKITDVDNAVTPTEDLWTNAIEAFDKNDKGMGTFTFIKTAEGNNQVGIQAINQNSDGHEVYSAIAAKVNNEGVATTYAPKPLASSNDNNIATTSWVNDKVNPIKNNYVTTNTAQDISAPKTFVGDNGNTINLVSNNIDYDNPPSTSTDGKVIFFSDKKNKNLGAIYSGVYANSDGIDVVFSRLQAHNDKNTTVPNAYLEVQSTTWGTMAAYAPSNITHTNLAEIATTDWVNSKISAGGGSNPVGTIIPFAGSSIPTGYLLCNGAVVSRTTYANLFKAIGTAYGAGDGSTTFKLPDLRDRFLEGAGTNAIGRYLSAGLPNITGETGYFVRNQDFPSTGALYNNTHAITNLDSFAHEKYLFIGTVGINANSSNTTYGSSSTVQPQSMVVQYLIKY